jgi:hypothetical protein
VARPKDKGHRCSSTGGRVCKDPYDCRRCVHLRVRHVLRFVCPACLRKLSDTAHVLPHWGVGPCEECLLDSIMLTCVSV